MLDTKAAYEVLGLHKGANKNDIEKRFTIILKKYRLESQEGASSVDMDRITQAYNLLMGYSEELPQPSGKPNPVLKKMGIDEKKARNFLYYHKTHIIVSIIVLIVAFFTIKSIVTKVDPDINLAFVGSFYYSDSTKFQDEIKKAVTDIKAVSIDQAFIYPDDKSDQGPAMMMKATVILAAEDIDLYILDKSNFDKFAEQGAFKSLDDLTGSLGIDKTANKDYVVKVQDEQTEHLYGVNVSNSKLFTNCGIEGKEKIAAFGIKGKFESRAVKVLELLLKN